MIWWNYLHVAEKMEACHFIYTCRLQKSIGYRIDIIFIFSSNPKWSSSDILILVNTAISHYFNYKLMIKVAYFSDYIAGIATYVYAKTNP